MRPVQGGRHRAALSGVGSGTTEAEPVPGLRPLALIAPVAAAVFVLDQLTKQWAVATLDDRTIDVVWTLRFNLVRNTGAAFSLLVGLGPFIAIGVVVVVIVLVRTGRSAATRPMAVAIGLIVGGALGNLADRVFRSGDGFLGGAVVDFVDLQWWPVFNVADASVVIGSALLVLSGMRTVER